MILNSVAMDAANKICRTCLSVTDTLIKLFTCSYAKTHVCNVIQSVAFVEITFGDGLPEEVCQACVDRASAAYDYKFLCERSDATLRKSIFAQPFLKIDDSDQINECGMINISDILKSDEKLTQNSVLHTAATVEENQFKSTSDIYKGIFFDDFTADESKTTQRLKDVGAEILEKTDTELNVSRKKASIDDADEDSFRYKVATKKYECVVCMHTFQNETKLRIHKRSHSLDKKHNCHLCNKTFSRIYMLQHHLITHTEQKAHLCPVCGKRFHLAGGLRQHLKYHRGNKPHACEICNKRYFNLHVLKEHVRCAHSNDRYSYACSVCDKKFTAKSTLKSHTRIHTGEKAHSCELCNKKFTRASYLRVHMRQHTKEAPPRLFLCSYENCERVYTTKASLEVHIRHRHTQERPFSCEICGKSFSSLPCLNDHRHMHTGEKPEECVLCGNRFVNKQSLKKHMRLHTGERPYPCEHCGERFLSSSRRNEHIQTKHMERQQECSVCNKRFHLKHTLKRHMLIHNSEKESSVQTPLQNVSSIIPNSSDTKQNVPEPGFEVIV